MYARRLQQLRRRENLRHEQRERHHEHVLARHELVQHAVRIVR
jgi:hypothetical protein